MASWAGISAPVSLDKANALVDGLTVGGEEWVDSDFCRRQHYKCDGILPRCGRCEGSNRVCVRAPTLKFRRSSSSNNGLNFPEDQIWVSLPPRVDFKDETQDVQNDYQISGSYETSAWERNSSPDADVYFTPTAVSPVLGGGRVKTSIDCSSAKSTAESPSDQKGPEDRREMPSGKSIDGYSPSKIYSDPPRWPLEDSTQAFLLQHFIGKIAPFFDFNDQQRHFQLVVPQRARVCRTLLNAIMALSSRHFSQTNDPALLPSYLADHYQQECLKTLIPALGDDVSILDETLLATIILLRLLEELDVAIGLSDTQRHLTGSQSLTQAQEQIGMGSGLRQASYWACLRQEIYISLEHQRPVHLNLCNYRKLAESTEKTDNCWWANRTTLHTAEVLQFSFGDEPKSRFQELLECHIWMKRRGVESFQPFYYREGYTKAHSCMFPDIRYGADWQVMGSQYLILSHILLVIHNPLLPKAGPGYQTAMEEVKEKVKEDIRMLCGTAESNSSVGAALVVACMAISLCGDYFDDRQEEERLLSILVKTEKEQGWPTQGLQMRMRQVWCWT